MKRQVPQDLPMGWLRSRLMFPVSWLILVWVAGSGSVKVLNAPTCFSDYIFTSTCEWKMDGPTNCSNNLRLSYQLNFEGFENHTCVPENRESTVCVCTMLIAEPVIADVYQLDLWAGRQQLWSDSFKPSSHVKPRAPGNLTIHPTSQTWVLTWSNPYPDENYLHRELTYLVNVSNEHDPADVSGHCGVSPPPPGTWAGGDSGSGAGQQTQGPRLVLRPDPPCLQASIPRGREGKLFLGTALMCKGKLWGPVYILGDGTLEILGGSLAAP
nr:interleukin-4 receptor subunit alpha-like isoform X4 [Manis javanica]